MNKVILNEKKDYKFYKYGIEYDPNNGYSIIIGVEDNDKIDDLLSTTGDLKDKTNLEIQVQKNMELSKQENIKDLIKIINLKDEDIKSIEYIEVLIDLDNFEKLIKDSKLIENKKIIFSTYEDVNLEILDRIKKILKGKTDNIYFNIKRKNNISFNECYEKLKKIEEIANHIKNLNLSPIEQIMYAYDIVKETIYKESDEDENNFSYISSAILGKSTISDRYAKRLKYIMNNLGISSEDVVLKIENENNHTRNLIRVKDDKYDIDGYYYFDASEDSKKVENDDLYLRLYTHFAKTRRQIDRLDREKGKVIDKNFPVFEDTMIHEFEDVVATNGLESAREDLIKSINYMFMKDKSLKAISKVNLESSEPYIKLDIEKLIKELEEKYEKFDSEIPAEKMLKILYDVRKCQYYENPEKYPFNMKTLLLTLAYSEWNFETGREDIIEHDFMTREEKFKWDWIKFLNYNKKENFDRNIEGVKLAKVLSNLYENKANNNK